MYLNPNWPESYGGHLELWNRNLTSCGQRVLPALGRFVAFSSTDFSYHGHPQPLQIPLGRARRSLALYYYTNGRPLHECAHVDEAAQRCVEPGGVVGATKWQALSHCRRCEEARCAHYKDSLDVQVEGAKASAEVKRVDKRRPMGLSRNHRPFTAQDWL